MTRYAAALSEHPSPPEAVGEVVGEILERLGSEPDVAAIFVTEAWAGALDDIAGAVRTMLRPGCLIGAASTAVIGGARAVEAGPGVALWAGRTGPARAVRLFTRPLDDGVKVLGMPRHAAEGGPRTMVLLADPFTLPADALLSMMHADLPDLRVVGGLVSGGRGVSPMVLDDEVFHDGAVGVLLAPGVAVDPVVSQGAKPVGEPMIVTSKSSDDQVSTLAGRPALDQLLAVASDAAEEPHWIFERGPQVGVVVDESKLRFGPGDFLVRGITALDPESRGISVAAQVPVGTTVQFHVRDAESAHDELAEVMAGVAAEAEAGADRGGLLFTSTDRGSTFFGRPDHDAEVVADALGPAVVGMACAGELAPIGGVSRVHTKAAVTVVFD